MEWKLTLPGYSGLRHCSWRREVWNNHVFQTPWKVKAGAMNDGQPEKCKFAAAFHEVDHFKNYSLSLHLGSSLSKKAHFLEGNRFSWACAVAPSFLRSILSLSCHSFLDVPPAPSSWTLTDQKMASHCTYLHKGGWHPALYRSVYTWVSYLMPPSWRVPSYPGWPSPCLAKPLHVVVPQYIFLEWMSVYALDDEGNIITVVWKIYI